MSVIEQTDSAITNGAFIGGGLVAGGLAAYLVDGVPPSAVAAVVFVVIAAVAFRERRS